MPPKIDWPAVIFRWDTLLTIGGNLLPLLGIFWLGWDASTLIILYWMETAIIGFWLIVRLLFAGKASLPPIRTKAGELAAPGPVLALFFLVHAGMFMGVHLIFLATLATGEWTRHLGWPWDFMRNFVIPSGLWIPLAGLFVIRAIITLDEIRSGNAPGHFIAGFYGRIFLMQFVIILGGFLTMTMGSPTVLLVLIVIFKIAFEIGWVAFAPAIESAIFSRKPQS